MSINTMTQVETKDDNIYYNVTMVNNKQISVSAQISQQLPSSILNNPADYYLSVARFQVTGTVIPFFFFQPNTYYATLQYGTYIFTTPVVHVITAPGVGPYNYAIFSYSEFLREINTAYETAWTGLNAAVPGGLPVGSTAPYMLYEQSNGLISLYADGRYYDEDNVVPYIQVWMNSSLYRFFDNFYIFFRSEGNIDNKDIRIRVVNFHNSNTNTLNPSIPVNFYKMSQEGSNNSRFWQPNSIVFKTNRIGTRPEYVQGTNSTSELASTNNNSGSGTPFDTILTDFIPAFNSSDQIGWKTDLVYNPAFYRLIDLLGNQSNAIDVAIFWRDQQGNEYPFYIEGGRSASIKLAFLKKSLFKNYIKTNIPQ